MVSQVMLCLQVTRQGVEEKTVVKKSIVIVIIVTYFRLKIHIQRKLNKPNLCQYGLILFYKAWRAAAKNVQRGGYRHVLFSFQMKST